MASPEITDELIVAFADGELSENEAKMVRDAIDNNPELKRDFENYSKSGELLRDFFRSSPKKKPLITSLKTYGNFTGRKIIQKIKMHGIVTLYPLTRSRIEWLEHPQ